MSGTSSIRSTTMVALSAMMRSVSIAFWAAPKNRGPLM